MLYVQHDYSVSSDGNLNDLYCRPLVVGRFLYYLIPGRLAKKCSESRDPQPSLVVSWAIRVQV